MSNVIKISEQRESPSTSQPGGYFVIPRTLSRSDAWTKAQPLYKLFLHTLIETVNFSEKSVTIKGEAVTIQPGETYRSHSSLAEICGIGFTKDIVKRAIQYWQKAEVLESKTVEFLARKSDSTGAYLARSGRMRVTKISLCNYEAFTAEGYQLKSVPARNWRVNNPEVAQIEECKELEISNKPKTSMSSSSNPTAKVSPLPSKISDQANEVFEHWKSVMGKGDRAKLNAKRKSAVLARFKEGYTVDDLKAAIDGCAKSSHHMGQNDRATMYNDLELICRDGARVEKFAFDIGRGKASRPKSSEPMSYAEKVAEQELQAEIARNKRRKAREARGEA